jgi:undecaprenyl-diphosphatase
MHATISLLQAIVLGLVQGLTELFPISSLGHGVLIPALLGWRNLAAHTNFFLVFLVGTHVGTAIGLLYYYRATWLSIIRGVFNQLSRSRTNGVGSFWRLNDQSTNPYYRLFVILLIGTVPVGLVGVVFEHKLRTLFAKPLDAAIFLTINGFVLLFAEYLLKGRGRRVTEKSVGKLPVRNVLVIGASQILALFAGISRSGVTMVSGLLTGLSHEEAANFSFLLATPVIMLAGLYKLPSLFGALGHGVRTQTFIGALCALIASYISVRFLTKWFSTKTLRPFGLYCLVFGTICIVRFA